MPASVPVILSISRGRRVPSRQPLSPPVPVVQSRWKRGKAVKTRFRPVRAPAAASFRVVTPVKRSVTSVTAHLAPSSCQLHADVARRRSPLPVTRSSARSPRVGKRCCAPLRVDRFVIVGGTSVDGLAVRCTFWPSPSQGRSHPQGSSKNRTQLACTTAMCRAQSRLNADFTAVP